MAIKINFSDILAVYLVLAFLGVVYDQLIDWMMKRKYLEGYKFMAAGFGVLITVGMTAFFIGIYALLVLGAFISIGLPLAGGEIWRYMKAREREQDFIRQEASQYHWKTEPLTPNPSPEGRGEEIHPLDRGTGI